MEIGKENKSGQVRVDWTKRSGNYLSFVHNLATCDGSKDGIKRMRQLTTFHSS